MDAMLGQRLDPFEWFVRASSSQFVAVEASPIANESKLRPRQRPAENRPIERDCRTLAAVLGMEVRDRMVALVPVIVIEIPKKSLTRGTTTGLSAGEPSASKPRRYPAKTGNAIRCEL